MRKYLAAFALAAMLVQPASAITFPSLTTIYVVTGVTDSGSAANTGLATALVCSNVSGVTTQIRFLVLNEIGSVLQSVIVFSVPHGATIQVSTHGVALFDNETSIIPGTLLNSGVVNIESLQSAVFCTAHILDASSEVPNGIDPHIVRVNPHPGAVE